MKMNVAMMQPTFLPWQGFFELIYKSDVFIFLDDFQFSVQSYHQRNRLLVNKGQVDWYTVPVKKSESFKAPLNRTIINEDTGWRDTMLKRIQNNYCRARYYKEIAPRVKDWLSSKPENLVLQNIAFISLVIELLGFKREIRFSSQNPSMEKRSRRVLELLQWCRADNYYCANGAFSYMHEDAVFPIDSIKVLFQDFKAIPYEQVGIKGKFIPNLSILDALMNIGPQATAELVQNGTARWMSWEEMSSMQNEHQV